ncbi:hypothetical protein ES703_39637 [subsurface metagenome]
MVKDSELYGIKIINLETILTKNVFTTYLPISASIYMSDKGIPTTYLKREESGLVISQTRFEELLGIRSSDFSRISWNSEGRKSSFGKSIRAPGIDMLPVFGRRELIELEVKLTVVPTYAKEKTTEMIIRQNTQFNFAERLCYYYGDFFEKDMDFDKIKNFLEENWLRQNPFIVHGLWKTIRDTPKLDRKNTLDVVVISDFAYLHMLLSAPQTKGMITGAAKTRIGRVVDLIIGWINEYKNQGKMIYKGPLEGSKDHLKITLYPVDYKPELKSVFNNLRLSYEDLLKIVPKKSIKALSPERRLDASLYFALAAEES